MAVGRSLREWQDRPADQVIKASKRRVMKTEGTYFFKVLYAKFNTESEMLLLVGVPFIINKSGVKVEYEKITLCIPITYTTDDSIIPFQELCNTLGIDPNEEITLSVFKDKVFEVNININEYVDNNGSVIARFYNPDHFSSYTEK